MALFVMFSFSVVVSVCTCVSIYLLARTPLKTRFLISMGLSWVITASTNSKFWMSNLLQTQIIHKKELLYVVLKV